MKAVTDPDHRAGKGLVAKYSGFSLHAGVSCKADERDELERIARYIARPPVAEERLHTKATGEVIYTFKKPWDDGTAAIKLSPLELIEKLVALIPRPRVHLTRYSGVLAPHYRYRSQIVPKPPDGPAAVAAPAQTSGPSSDTTNQVGGDPITSCGEGDDCGRRKRMTWARLLARVFKIDVETCPKCGGHVRIIAAIEEPKVIKQILEHLGLPSHPPRPHQPRAPPTSDCSGSDPTRQLTAAFDFDQSSPYSD